MALAEGYICPNCGHMKFYLHEKRHLLQCKKCGYQASITSRTIFHRTRVPLLKWFRLIYLVLRNVKTGRLYILRETLGIRNHKTFWAMRKKIDKIIADPGMKKRLSDLLGLN